MKRLHEECGIFGIFGAEDAPTLTYYGLHSLQHRGQESAGITAFSDGHMLSVKDKGLVTEVFDAEKIRSLGSTDRAVGHVRYSTKGANIIENIQPISVRSHRGDFALSHNGQIINSDQLKYDLETQGSIFHGTTDSEVIAHIIQKEEGSMVERIKKACQILDGSFSLLILTEEALFAVRDKYGFRPLCIGKIEDGYAAASESCAFEIVGADLIRDVLPGEIVEINEKGIHSHRYTEAACPSFCAMEYVYFSRPDSEIDGRNVHATRKLTGRLIAHDDHCKADIVIGVPDSSLSAAMGYAEERGLPYEMGLIKNKYIGRTFIQPSQKERDRGVRMKLSAVGPIVRNKRIVLVDDSIVRGTTSHRIVKMLRESGAKEVHLRIVSPPLKYACYYGIDINDAHQLAANKMSIEELRKWVDADSLKFLSLDTLFAAAGSGLCTACFNGNYPTELYGNGENKC